MSATSRKAHPRSRGENSVADTEIATHRGSSPLTRGKLPGENDSRAWAGLIPAHAGKTITWLAQLITSWAHPRSRGENVRRAQYPPPTGGSSPLTRGKPSVFPCTGHQCGLIPAHAGKTSSRQSCNCQASAHPRSRGENSKTCVACLSLGGSSPLTRGKQVGAGFRRSRGRLIPAHAGKTARVTRLHRHQRAHPRSRGENGFARLEGGGVRGSSPLTRGKPPPSGRYQAVPRLIPAHAGKTTPARCASEGPGAHPRSRGENCSSSTHTRSGRGSSPLTRGKRVDRRSPISCPRLIPAHAGKTGHVRLRHAGDPAHPRSRGENG